MIHLSDKIICFSRYFENVWIQDYDYLERCTAFVYKTVEFNDCNMKNSFICEIDPKIVINPLSFFQADFVIVGVLALLALGLPILCCICICWFRKSKTRHMQRLQRRNSIRASIRSLNMIDPQGGSMRRQYMNGRSSESLSKSRGTDYKKMMSNGSFDSMDKSVISTTNSFTDYEININPNPQPRYNDYSIQPTKRYSPPDTPLKSKAYGLPPTPPLPLNSFELAYRNDGFRDNSMNATRNASVATNINEDTPIIHQVDNEEYNSDYYGNASTLPIRAKGENLSFLNELKQRLPEYEAPRINSGHSSFLPQGSERNSSASQSSGTPPPSFENHSKNDKTNLISSSKPRIEPIQMRRDPTAVADVRRPDSYLKAVRKTARESILPKSEYGRPKTVYESSTEPATPPARPAQPPPPQPYTRSKSEAVLETNFDSKAQVPENLMSSDNRSQSQPLETEF